MSPTVSAFEVYQKKRRANQAKRKNKSKTLGRNVTKKLLTPSRASATEGSYSEDDETSVRFNVPSRKSVQRCKLEQSKKLNLGDSLWETETEDEQMPVTMDALQSRGDRHTGIKRAMQAVASQHKRKNVVEKRKRRKLNKDSNTDRETVEKDCDSSNSSANEMQDTGKQGDSVEDSIKEGEKLLEWLISPYDQTEFFKNAWEKKPLHITRRTCPDYYKYLLSTPMIDNILRCNNIQFSKHVDITSYVNEQRETLNPPGRATPNVVWNFYNQGCSVRLLNPQTFSRSLGILNATLQEFFGCFVGANAYLTPSDSQGFAPHYDDIEAFILQIEGKKHWKIYPPRKEGEKLPRTSSADFMPDDIGDPTLEVTVNAGDVLYFPRGWIHQAYTVPGSHSLHITVSCYQRTSWIDLFEKMLPAAVSVASNDNVEFRMGLPLGYLQVMGVAHSELNTPGRKKFLQQFQYLLTKLVDLIPIDAAVDQFGKQFMHDALPPILSEEEKKRSVLSTETKIGSDGKVRVSKKLTKDSKIKLVRAHVLRVVSEEEKVMVYHCANNSTEYHEYEIQVFEIHPKQASMVEFLQHVYPRYIEVGELPGKRERIDRRVDLANLLWENGVLLTEEY